MNSSITSVSFLLLFFIFIGNQAYAQWPKNIAAKDGTIITLYQPQPETFVGDNQGAHAAVSVTPACKKSIE